MESVERPELPAKGLLQFPYEGTSEAGQAGLESAGLSGSGRLWVVGLSLAVQDLPRCDELSREGSSAEEKVGRGVDPGPVVCIWKESFILHN